MKLFCDDCCTPIYSVMFTLCGACLDRRAARLKAEGRMPTREQYEAVLTDVLGPKVRTIADAADPQEN